MARRDGTFGPPPRDPNGGVTSTGAAIGRGLGVLRDYLQQLADTARDIDEINIYNEVLSQLEPGEDVVIYLNDFNAPTGYQSISGGYLGDPVIYSDETRTIRVSKPDQRFAGVCPVNPEDNRRQTTEVVYVTRPGGQRVAVPLRSPPSGPNDRPDRSRDIRYNNNNFDRLRDKDLNDPWDGSFDPRRIA